MTRLFCFSLVAVLASYLPIQAQEKTAPPKNFTNSIGMKFVWIPPGTLMMGSPKDEKGRDENEMQHKVTLTKGFYMGVFTVTQEQWQEIMGKNPSHFKGEKNLPVEMVSWNDCQEFVKILQGKEKKPYRLPTEAEWEYACRAGTRTPFHFGKRISTDQANYNGESIPYGNGEKGVFREKSTPVGTFPPNLFGLYDMHGNVLQWCQDRYGDYPQEVVVDYQLLKPSIQWNPYRTGLVTSTIKHVVDPQGPNSGKHRVMRGGSWNIDPEYCRSAFRLIMEPNYRHYIYGVRVCFFVE